MIPTNRMPVAAMVAAALLAPIAHAGEAADLAKEAEDLAANGQHVEALETMRDAFGKIWSAAPLGEHPLLFVSREPEGHDKNTEDYFLAGRALPWWAIGASLIASNISAEQIIGQS